MNNKRNLEEMVKVNNHYSRFIAEYDMEFRTKHFNLKRLIDMETVNDLGFVFVVVDNGETYYDFETFYHVSEETGELLLDEVLLPQGEEYPLFSSPDNETVEIPNTNVFGVRVRHADASSYDWYELNTVVGLTNSFILASPIALSILYLYLEISSSNTNFPSFSFIPNSNVLWECSRYTKSSPSSGIGYSDYFSFNASTVFSP